MNKRLGYVKHHGKRLRCGYTTGTCAAATAKSAVDMLLNQKMTTFSRINLPGGEDLELKIHDPMITKSFSQCTVIKDSGDDVDITDGIRVIAKALIVSTPGVHILGGEGIGTVTLDGLSIPKGSAAINPIPYEMIQNEVTKVCDKRHFSLQKKGIEITISIPGGERIAERTLNPKLGIKGGLSILGTTGIVRPMSNEALVESIKLEISVLSERESRLKEKIACFVPGNYGEAFARNLGVEYGIIKISNFIGTMLESAVEQGLKKILLIGDLGKLVKISAGIFQTHSKVSDARAEILAANAAALGASIPVINELLNINTTAAAVKIIDKEHLTEIYQILVDKIKKRCQEFVHGEIIVEVILFTGNERELARTDRAQCFIEELKELCFE